MADIFNAPDSNAIPEYAPGIPQGALSGNPWATYANITAIDAANRGAFMGGAFGGALAEAFGQPEVDPQQLMADRQDAFTAEIDAEIAQGASYGEALLKASKAGYLAPDERFRASQQARKFLREDQKIARDTSDDLYQSDAYKGFVSSKNNWTAMK